ncbi:hypothetical protein [Clostridium oceanicum]|uniref:Uncharacterized protein n=1 Tax=Clostridium oceanicum TaxID=1543 RepID=A0ABN1JES7_9CLOT
MERRNYIFSHPNRVFVRENCIYLKKQEDDLWIKSKGEVVIPVDGLKENQDPYVFSNPWIYGNSNNKISLTEPICEESTILFGKYHKDCYSGNYKFLVDNIFIVDKKYSLDNKSERSIFLDHFVKDYPNFKENKIYKDFSNKMLNYNKSLNLILSSKLLNSKSDFINLKDYKYKNLFSFIPLIKDNNNKFSLIDIMPVILKYNPDHFNNFLKNPKKLYPIDSITLKHVIDYVLKNSNTLITETESIGAPKKLDMKLQYEYYKLIYGGLNKAANI